MVDPVVDRDPVEILAAEFLDRMRRGEHPSIEEYAQQHPEIGDQIRELFPTIAAMEQWKTHEEVRSGGRVSMGGARIERLGDLKIVREIGRGGMGIVYEAEQESLGRRVAVKVLPKQLLLDDKHLKRFRREAKTAAKLHHTNIVPILGVGEQDGYHYYVMQFIRGVGLDEIIPEIPVLRTEVSDSISAEPQPADRASNVTSVARALVHGEFRKVKASSLSSASSEFFNADSKSGRRDDTPASPPGSAPTIDLDGEQEQVGHSTEFSIVEPDLESTVDDVRGIEDSEKSARRLGANYWRSVARIGVQVADALHYAHLQGTLHRDIKPANLLLDERGTVWVADFGLAKAMEHDDVSRTGDVVGTLRYMAPEQFTGHADARSDIFSLGLTLYELVAFQPAFEEQERKQLLIRQAGTVEPTRPRRCTPEIPRDLETIVLKAISAEPEHRYQTAAALEADLQRFLEDRPIEARRATNVERFVRWCRRNPAIATSSGIALLLLVAVTVVSSVGYIKTSAANKLKTAALEAETVQRRKAEQTSDWAWKALDRIFERLTPTRMVSPADFDTQVQSEEDLASTPAPVLSNETAALLDEMLLFYDQLAALGDNDSTFQKRIAEANRRVGDIRQRLGQFEQAKTAYLDAIAKFQQLDADSSQDPETRTHLAGIHNELGNVFRRERSPEAWQAYASARDLLEPIVEREDSPPEAQYELARTFYLQGRLAEGAWRGGGGRGGPGRGGPGRGGSGGPAGLDGPGRQGPGFSGQGPGGPGRGEFNRGRGPGRGDQLRNDDELRPDRQMGGPANEGRLSQSSEGRFFAFLERRGASNLSKAIEYLEPLTKAYQEVPEYRQLLALCYVERSKYLRPAQSQEADAAIHQGLEILKELVDEYPANPDYRFALSAAYSVGYPGDPSLTEDQLPTIEARLAEALKLLKQLNREHPNVPEYLESQVKIYEHRADVLTRFRRFEEAAQCFEEGLRVQRSLRRYGSPTSVASRSARLHMRYADLLAKQHKSESAPELVEKAKQQIAAAIAAVDQMSDRPESEATESSRRFDRFRSSFLFWRAAEVYHELGDFEAEQAAKERSGGDPFGRSRRNRTGSRGE